MPTPTELQNILIRQIQQIQDVDYLQFIQNQINAHAVQRNVPLATTTYSSLRKELLDVKNRSSVQLERDWLEQFPTESGVILLMEEGKVCLVVEANNIRSILSELLALGENKQRLRKRIANHKIAKEERLKAYRYRPNGWQQISNYIDQILEDNFEVAVLKMGELRKEFIQQLKQQYQPRYNVTVNEQQAVAKKSNKKAYSVANIRETHQNAYRKWTEEDDRLLRQWYEAGATIRDLAKKFKRNNGSIKSRLKKLGM